MSINKYSIICTSCNKEEITSLILCSSCKSLLKTIYKQPKKIFNFNKTHLQRKSIFEIFQDSLPFNHLYSFLKESCFTPFISLQKLSEEYKCNIFAKLEFTNITSSVKDREAIIEVSKAKDLGYKTIIVASTGNLAASLAVYAQKANIKCKIYVPWTTSFAKVQQIKLYGAEIKRLRKTYDELVSFVKEEAEKKHYFLGGLQAFRSDGYKTVAYEIFLQAEIFPSIIIIPMGDGTTISGIYQGFKDLYDYGYIKKLPQLIGVQEENIDPIIKKWNNDKKSIKENSLGIAKAINIRNPQDINLVFEAIRNSQGDLMSVSLSEIIESYKELAQKEGIYSEYASATTLAALKKMLPLKTDSHIALIITGSGLKN